MAKKQEENLPTRVGNVPDSLINMLSQGELGDSLETMKHHRVLNRINLIQSTSAREMKAKYGEGSIVIPVTETKLAAAGESFLFVPVMFFDEFIVWADRKDTTGNKILERSLDRAGTIAIRSSDPMKRKEPYGEDGKLVKSYTHHLNFLVVIYDGPFKGTLCVLSFSRSAFKKGMSLIGAIKMRRIKTNQGSAQAPMWATVWKASVSERSNDKGEWYGIDFEAAENPWIENEDIGSFKTMHEELLKDYKEQAIVVGHEAADTGHEDPAADTEM